MPFGTNYIEQMADFILWYAKSKLDSQGSPYATYRKLFRPEVNRTGFNNVELPNGDRMTLSEAKARFGEVPVGARLWNIEVLGAVWPHGIGSFQSYVRR